MNRYPLGVWQECCSLWKQGASHTRPVFISACNFTNSSLDLNSRFHHAHKLSTESWRISTSAETSMSVDRPRILLLLDDRSIADLIVARLRQENLEFVSVRDEATALQKARELVPATIILGLHKASNVPSFCRKIRRSPALHEVPILVLTGSSDGAEVTESGRIVTMSRNPMEIEEVMGQIRALSRPHVWEPIADDVV